MNDISTDFFGKYQVITVSQQRADRYNAAIDALLDPCNAPQPGGPWVASDPWQGDPAVFEAIDRAVRFGFACGDVGG